MSVDRTLGTTIRFLATFINPTDDSLFDPSSTWGRIWDSSSTVVQSISALTKISTGYYYYDWQTIPGSHAFGLGAAELAGRSGSYNHLERLQLFRLM
jgi:hypothetical protein